MIQLASNPTTDVVVYEGATPAQPTFYIDQLKITGSDKMRAYQNLRGALKLYSSNSRLKDFAFSS